MSRHCTLLAIPWFRDFYERNYSTLCESHDEMYAAAIGKLKADWYMVSDMWRMGRWFDYPMAIGTFLIVQLPWVWGEYLWKKWRNKYARNKVI